MQNIVTSECLEITCLVGLQIIKLIYIDINVINVKSLCLGRQESLATSDFFAANLPENFPHLQNIGHLPIIILHF